MNRLAILIGSPLEKGDEGFLPGVAHDIRDYYAFLQSPSGGGWFENEVIRFRNPRKDKLEELFRQIDRSNVDYLMIVYAGHGFMDYSGKSYFSLNNLQEYISLSKLKQINVDRKLIISDACRDYVSRFSGIAGVTEGLKIENGLTLGEARKAFDIKLASSSIGYVIIQSSEPGKSSGDMGTGGTFSQNFLEDAIAWAAMNQGWYEDRFQTMTVLNAFFQTKISMQQAGTDQTPTCKHTKGMESFFPFAIRRKSSGYLY